MADGYCHHHLVIQGAELLGKFTALIAGGVFELLFGSIKVRRIKIVFF